MVNLQSNTLSWSEITFPLFPLGLGIEGFYEEDKILFAKDHTGYRILDDKNLKGDSLGGRRLHLKAETKQIYPLKRKIDTLVDLVKYSKVYKYYIDVKGKHFKYKKTRFTKLLYRPILFSKFVEGKGTVFMVKGVNNWFEVNYLLNPEARWAGLLKIDRTWLLYDISFEKKQDSRRKV